METLQLCVIGFGVSGIALTRWAKMKGLNFITLESKPFSGGVWRTKSYPGLILQTTKHSYSFSDEPMPRHFPLHPTHEQILQYMKDYIAKHDLEDNVRYNQEVSHVTKSQDGYHIVSYRDKRKGSQLLKRIKCKYLAVASGLYTSAKYPDEIDSTCYRGDFCHASEFAQDNAYHNYDFLDKRVVIIGNGPSGCDLATLAVKKGAKNVTVLYRTPRWIFTRYLGNIGLNFFTNRLFLWISMKLPTTVFLACLYVVFFIPYYLFGLRHNLDLPTRIVNRNNLALNEEFVFFLNIHKIQYLRSSVINFKGKTVVNKDHEGKETHLDSDICICATGYHQGVPFLKRDKMPLLYKRILDPNDETLAFIGFSPSFNWVQLSDLQARWFVKMICGEMILPNKWERDKQLRDDIKKNEKLLTEYHDLAYLAYIYSDDLFAQMGLVKTPMNWITQWWEPARFDQWAGI